MVDRLKTQPLMYRLIRGATWAAIGSILVRGLSLISSILIARMLGKEDYGELGIIQSTIGMFATFAGLGLGLTATKYVAEFRERNPIRCGRIIGLSILMAVCAGSLMTALLFMGAPWLAANSLAAPHLSGLLQISSPLLLFGALSGVQIGVLSGFEAFPKLARVNALVGVVAVPMTVFGVWAYDVEGAVLAMVAATILQFFVSQHALRQEAKRFGVRASLAQAGQELPVLWRFSLPAMLSNIVVTPAIWISNSILVNQVNGYQEMGVLNAANQWRIALMFLPSLIMQAILPIMSETNARNDSSDFGKTLVMSQTFMVLLAVPLGVCLMFCSDVLISLYGTEFENASIPLIAVLASFTLAAVGASGGSAIQAKGKMWLGFLFNASFGAILVLVSALFAEEYGASAIAFANFVAYLALTLWSYTVLRPGLPAGLYRRVLLAAGFVTGMTILCVLLPAPTRLWLALPMTAISMIIVSLFLADRATLNTLLQQIRREPQQPTTA